MAGVGISDQELFRRGAALGVVIGLHALLIAAWSHLSSNRRSIVDAQERRGVLTLLEIKPQPQRVQTAPERRAVAPGPKETDEIATTAITLPPTPSPAASGAFSPPVDWRMEGELSGRAAVEDAARAGPRPFGPQPASEPEPKPKEFEWDPEPSRAGFAGALPYVRLGKRCVVGLGFFGCAIGDLPEANGKLFEGMRDPHRHESSVPDPQE